MLFFIHLFKAKFIVILWDLLKLKKIYQIYYKLYFITNTMVIPKIIHQLAPTDITKWHPLWSHCQNSWKNIFQILNTKCETISTLIN